MLEKTRVHSPQRPHSYDQVPMAVAHWALRGCRHTFQCPPILVKGAEGWQLCSGLLDFLPGPNSETWDKQSRGTPQSPASPALPSGKQHPQWLRKLLMSLHLTFTLTPVDRYSSHFINEKQRLCEVTWQSCSQSQPLPGTMSESMYKGLSECSVMAEAPQVSEGTTRGI